MKGGQIRERSEMIVDKAYYDTKCRLGGPTPVSISMKTNRDPEQCKKVKISNKWKPIKQPDYKFECASTDKWSLENPVAV